MMQTEQDISPSVQVRVYIFGPLEIWKRDSSGTWKLVPKDKWKNSKPARTTLRRLLVQPGRRLSREQLADDVWSESNAEPTDTTVYSTISLVRGVIGKPLVTLSTSSYEIAGQELIWTDFDACEALLKESENLGYTSLQALPLLEQALSLLERGELMEGDEGIWCYAFRKRAEDMFRQAHLWLTENYEIQGKLWQAGELHRAMVLHDPSDEEAVLHWLEMLLRHGKRQEALKWYQEMKQIADAQGFPLSSDLEQRVASLNAQPLIPSIMPVQPLEDVLLLPQYQGDLKTNYTRRQMLQGILAAACTTLTLAPYKLTPSAQSEYVPLSVHDPFLMNEDMLTNFAEITERYWKLSANISLRLLNGLFGLFQDITQTLMASQTRGVTEKLYELSSEVAQILGKTLFDMRDYPLACSYYGFAMKASLEVHNHDLWAASLGRMGLLLLANDQPQQTLEFLEKAQGAPIQSAKIRSWHAAIEAETYAYLGKESLCRKALERAKDTSEGTFLEKDSYATGFTRARLASYEGSCYLRLNQPQHALPVLEEALTLIEPTALRRQARLLTYLGETYILLKQERRAYEYASQALDLTDQTLSLDILRHVRKMSDKFPARGTTTYRKDLDQHIEKTQAMITSVGGFHG